MDDEKRRRLFRDLLDAQVRKHATNPPRLTRISRTPEPRTMKAEAKSAFIDAVRAAFTEERTDALIAKLTKKIPFWLRWVPIGALLDRALPGALLEWLEESL